jgi:hypothetical protein
MLGGAFDNGNFAYFENLGSSTNPIFVDRRGDLSPLSDLGSDYRNPHFNDIDDDGDVDLVAADRFSNTVLIENTGTSTAPTFEFPTRSDNPFDSISGESAFAADFDRDGDPDLLVKNTVVSSQRFSFLLYYENIGSPSNPLFLRLEGTNNPLNGFSLSESSLTADDVDGDGISILSKTSDRTRLREASSFSKMEERRFRPYALRLQILSTELN